MTRHATDGAPPAPDAPTAMPVTPAAALPHARLRPRRTAALALATLLALSGVVSCGESPTGPGRILDGRGRLRVHANVGATITTMVVEVTAPDLPAPLAFNLTIANGQASGTVTLPAGANRTVTVRAFDQRTETHRGSRTITVVEGANAPLTITLAPLAGDQPITVQFGTVLVIVTPATATGAVGDTLRLGAVIQDVDGNALAGRVRWATLDPRRALVDTLGLVTIRDTGSVQVVATHGTVAGAASLRGLPATQVPTAILRRWVGGAAANARSWQVANNWDPATVPAATDSVVIPATANQPQLAAAATVRDLVVEEGAVLSTGGQALTVAGALAVRGSIVGGVNVRTGARLQGTLPFLDVRGSVALAGTTTAAGMNVLGTGTELDLNGQRLTITAALNVYQGGTIASDGVADTVESLADVNFGTDAGDHAGRITAGRWIARGTNFFGSRFLATGAHRLVMAGTAPQTLYSFDYLNGTDDGLAELELRNQVSLCAHLRVAGQLSITQPVAFTQGCGGYYVRADGEFVTVSGSSVGVYLVDLRAPGGTGAINGAWSPTFTDFNANGQAIRPDLAYQHLRVFRSQRLLGRTEAALGVQVDGAGTVLDLDGRTLRTAGAMNVTNGGALAMDQEADTLDVRGALDMNGAAAQGGTLTAGAMRIGGNFTGTPVAASGTHTVILDGAGPAQLLLGFDYVNRPANVLQHLVVANTNGALVCGHVRARGTFDLATPVTVAQGCGGYYVRVDGELRTVAGSTVSSYLFSLANASGTTNVQGTWRPDFTDFTLPGQPVNPALDYRNLRAFQSITLSGDTRVAGELYAEGAATAVTLAGHRVDVGGRLYLSTGATLVMQDAGDTARVAGDVLMNGGPQAGRLTAGVLAVGGNINATSFTASGTHKLLLDGQGGRQQLAGFDPARPVRLLEVANAAGVQLCTHMAVTNDVVVSTPVTLYGDCGGYTLQVRGVLRTVSGSVVSAYRVQLDDASGTSQVGGAFQPFIVAINAPGMALRPGLAYQNVELYQALTLPDSMTVSGSFTVSGNTGALTLGGRRLRVDGLFNLDANAVVNMTDPADSLVVAGGMFFDGGGDHTGRLTAGSVVWSGTGGSWNDYRASGTHRLVFTGTGGTTQQVNTGAGTFRHARVAGTAPVNFNCGSVVSGTFEVTGAATVTCCGVLTLLGPLATAAGSIFRPDGVELRDASGTRDVLGAFSPVNTRFNATAPVVRPGLAYNNLYFSTSATFTGRMNIGGLLQVDGNGAALTIGGNVVTVGNYLNTDATATLVMTNATDTVRVLGDVYLDATGDQTGLLTAGTLYVGGNTFAATAVRASGTHRVVLDGATGAPTTVGGNPVLRALDVAGGRGVNVTCDMTVTDTLRVLGSVPVTGCGTVRVVGPLITSAGSGVTFARLQLEHPSGTGLVAGAFSPTTTVIAAPDAVLAPALAYRGLEVLRPVTLSGSTTLAGPLTVTGTGTVLTLGGHRLSASGNVTIGANAVLVSTQPGDTLDARGTYLQFQSNAGDHTGFMTAGALLVGGDLYLDGDGVEMSGTHRTVFTGTGAGTQSVYNSTAARPLQDVRVEGTRSLAASSLVVRGAFTVATAEPITVGGGGTWVLQGPVASPATTTWSHNVVQFDGTSSPAGIAGPWTAQRTVFNGTAQVIPVAANLSYRSVDVRGADVRVAGSALFTGDLDIYGRLTVQAGAVADATGRVVLFTGSTLVNDQGGSVRYGTTYTAQAGSTLVGAAPVPR